MLGIVFTEFMEMVEERFSPDVLDDVLDTPGLESAGAYTSVGYYDYRDMIKMVVALSKRTAVPVDDLVEAFGEHMFGVLIGKYPMLEEGSDTTLDFLETVDSTVHREVLKLYPQAELPKFDSTRIDAHHLKMSYQSKRPFSRLALGLIKGCGNYYGETLDISHNSTDHDDQYLTNFDIKVVHE